MTTALITHEDCDGHVNPPGAPEQVARLHHVLRALERVNVLRTEAPMGTKAQAALCHDPAYIDAVAARVPERGTAWLDGDTYLSPNSLDAVYRAVGGSIAAVEMVLDGQAANVFVATRPPGHHAERATPMGFCIFGHISIAAKHALENRGLSRVAALDFDVHHGNGTQALLQEDARALFVSSHQMPLWPGTGYASETGPHDTIINLPLDPGSGGREMREVWSDALERVRDHAPELILVSAGFDAHMADPLANLRWTEDDFRWITSEICDLAADICDGRVVSILEGGYDLNALAASARVHVDELIKAAT
jgi:acetoin utilization deacetylase AcuC-like enzyme